MNGFHVNETNNHRHSHQLECMMPLDPPQKSVQQQQLVQQQTAITGTSLKPDENRDAVDVVEKPVECMVGILFESKSY